MVNLYQGDCLEVMKEIPDKYIDMVLCDLPYGTTCNAWDKKIDLQKLFAEYHRVIKQHGAIALFSQMPFSADLVNADRKHFRYEWIWQKAEGTCFLNAKRMPLKIHENILIFYDKLPTYNPQKWQSTPYNRGLADKSSTNYRAFESYNSGSTDGLRYPIDVIQFPQCNCTSEKPVHPTQKPVPLLEYLIKTYTNEYETVLDNCMGAGSTGVACINTNRNFIGIELDESYFQIAKKRIEQAEQSRNDNSSENCNVRGENCGERTTERQ